MNFIHPTTVVDRNLPAAALGDLNYFGPHCVIGPNVKLGIGNRFEAHVAIGLYAEHRDFWNPKKNDPGPVEIGNHNIVREFVTIQGGTSGTTKMSDRCVMLRGSHLSHDSVLEDDVNVSCNVLIGGETIVMKAANLGLGAILHQRQTVGSWVMLGMGSVATKKTELIPGYLFVGSPARNLKMNTVGLNRWNVMAQEHSAEVERWTRLKSRTF